ncbi:MAG: PEP-CTERM system histidine kinase PrsK [Candidatus Krumholzibacteria bacterium]|nr:PEP-CTERM system histidine kinase PrsK [Candidatus Krumholzibacteria bacterium]
MTYLPVVLSFGAGLLLVALGLLHLLRGQYKPQKTLFIVIVLLLALLQFVLGILLLTTSRGQAITALRVLLGLGLFLPALTVLFFMLFGKRNEREILESRRPWIVLAVILLGIVAVLLPVEFVATEVHFLEGLFWGVSFSGFGKLLGVGLLLSVVYSLFLFENMWRLASVPEKTTLKYPMLGIVTASILTFVVLSRVIAFALLDRNHVAVYSSGLVALSASFLFATMRYRLFDVRVYIGRNVVSSFVTIILAGVYLLALGLISFLAKWLGLPYDQLTLGVLGVLGVFFLVAILISGRAKRRIRRYLDQNFYLNRYDYRSEWRRNARLMASDMAIDRFLEDFISQLCESMMVEKGLMWIDVAGGKVASYGLSEPAIAEGDVYIVRSMLDAGEVCVLDMSKNNTDRLEKSDRLHWVRALAALGSGFETTGFIIVGHKALGLDYSEEDQDFLSTLADQATLIIENFKLAQKITDARQMETFNRFASFVIHDLKNTMGMLSLTAENAKDNIHDADFQRDAMDTIRRSVQKMKDLIHSLSAVRADASLKKRSVDMTSLIEQKTNTLMPVARRRGISLQFIGEPSLYAQVDPQAIERIVENLVHNAVDASKPGGEVEVHLARETNGTIRIEVIDQGEGFEVDYMSNHLFRPFRTTKKEGLGIGLTMCKTLAEAHGGNVYIESKPQRGARVSVRVPASHDGA